MTYNDIVTPIRKTIYGEADLIYTLLSSTHGRIDAIAKGIRKSTSKKRGNIDFGIFSSVHLIQGKGLDIIIEAQMLEYNADLLSSLGLQLLHRILPLLNNLATDIDHSVKIFDEVKKYFILFDNSKSILFEASLKYALLDIQNILPDWSLCSICSLHFEQISKYNIRSNLLVCNNCARKIESGSVTIPKNVGDLKDLNEKELELILNVLNMQIKYFT